MKITVLKLAADVIAGLVLHVRADNAQNPIIQAYVPDMALIRMGDTYYKVHGLSFRTVQLCDQDARWLRGFSIFQSGRKNPVILRHHLQAFAL
ncbi:MAG: hypothetical protein ABSE90_07005 [Verrucomicrobiota bacterium]